MTDPNLPTRTEGEGETLDMPQGMQPFTTGQVLGERYQILEMLGRGGMGEVWHAFDLKLRVEVALKALRPEFFKSERRLELLRQEVRAAREVVSPNVCRIFDLIEVEGRELVSMEYVDGATLLGVLQERGPLELKEAQDIASQFLAGLEAIHQAGLIHRDIKPENIMLTRAGRVVVMDFGLARQEAEGGGTVSGTPAYMSPEQAAGQTLDARADVYAAGVVLAEMVSPDGIKSFDSRQSVWEGVRSEPTKIPDTPWAPVIKQAVKKAREGRFNSAHTLTRALEDVTLRVEGADDLHPYPGLASFTEADAEYFFGREAEVEQMWRKLEGPPRMLALVGPSGAGKSSFLRAGLVPTRRPGWACIICTPGNDPRAALRRTVISELEGDSEALRELAVGSDDASVSAVTRWRRHHEQALVIVDQFEELFTQNTTDEQQRFAGLLGRLVLEADVLVLLSMRDDFLIHCNRHEELRPLFSDLTPLDPPTGAALRRALTQPALQCGYRFEDDELVDEMLAEVRGERGALPLLAFAAARLWERRDKQSGLLTREAYREIGGVGGALAQHAEATIDRIGVEQIPIVRELLRNLVTAEGTRAVREWNELLSIFSDSPSESQPEEVLRQLIDARLLTSYEIREGDEAPTRRVEIIHESLLANWPRLVRWQTQDQEGAQLRDELRQAARAWDEHDRQDDRLWTGTAFREYQLWRERYPGGLTDIEEAFAAAMTSLATRRKRRRRIAAVVGTAILLVVLAVVTGLWRHSLQQTRLARAETNRAEASKLLTLGESALADERTTALAYAIAALERSDTPEARRLALKALWAGPPATVVPQGGRAWGLAFAPNGSLLAAGSWGGGLKVFPRDGRPFVQLEGFEEKGIVSPLSFSSDSSLLIGSASAAQGEVHVWDTRTWLSERVIVVPDVGGAGGIFEPGGTTVVTVGFQYDGPGAAPPDRLGTWIVDRWPDGDGPPYRVGAIAGTQAPMAFPDLGRSMILVGQRDTVRLHRLETLGREPGRVIARHPEVFAMNSMPAYDPTADRVALADIGGNLLVWPLDGDGTRPERVIEKAYEPFFTAFSPDGSLLAQASGPKAARLWDLRGWGGAEPLRFLREGPQTNEVAFSPDNRWLATSGGGFGVALWPLTNRYCRVQHNSEHGVSYVAFSPDGSQLYKLGGNDGILLSWDMSAGAGIEPTVLFQTTPQWGWGLSVDPRGRFLVVGFTDGAWKVPLDGSDPTALDSLVRMGAELGPTGRLLAANYWNEGLTPTMVVLDLETGERWQFDPPGEGNVSYWGFGPAGEILMARGGILSRWDAASGATEILINEGVFQFEISQDGLRRLLILDDYSVELQDLEQGLRTRLTVPANSWFLGLDPSGSLLLVGTENGEVQVGPILGGEPHLLLGHEGGVSSVAVSPDGRWIVSEGADHTVRLWPMPDVTTPPFHTLPYDELMAKLKALTNLRAVPDKESSAGYAIEPDATAYRGWAVVPEW
jgi:serine/threonine protein kinase/WD40 repeat protein